MFQYKFLHRIVYTNDKLFAFKTVDSPYCTFCKNEVESTEHLFFFYKVINMLWLAVLISQNCNGNSTYHAELYKSPDIHTPPCVSMHICLTWTRFQKWSVITAVKLLQRNETQGSKLSKLFNIQLYNMSSFNLHCSSNCLQNLFHLFCFLFACFLLHILW